MEYSRKQKLASIYGRAILNKYGDDRYYIKNKREKGQKRYFTCGCCKERFDLGDSIDYVGAVEQWEQLGGKCYACGKGFCHCHTEGHK